MFKFIVLLLLASSPLTFAASCKCGSTRYSADDVDAAIDQGVTTNPSPSFGQRGYPHRFANREGIDFPHCESNEYVEFPLKQGEPYTGGPPGADRVIYSTDSQFCGCITHSGAPRRNGFVACTVEA